MKTAKEPKEPRPLKAFQVTDKDEGHADIVWATCGAAARRAMMGELSDEFSDLSTKRLPELDNFKGDLEQWKFHNNWWSNCHYAACHKERICEGDGAIYVKDEGWFCSEEHRALQAERDAANKATIAAAEARIRKIRPGLTIEKSYINVGGGVMMDVRLSNGERKSTSEAWLMREECEFL